MLAPQPHSKEGKRIKALEEYHILDTEYEKDFDDITRLASEICETPISLVSLVDRDRQWFKSTFGITIPETSRTISFCAHAINEEHLFQVEDARNDDRFHDSPLVLESPNIVFYAGTQLIDKNNLPLGTLCVIDTKPKVLTPFQKNALEILGHQVIKLIELKKANFQLLEKNEQLKNSYHELENFSHVITHDLKSPLNNIMELSKFLIEECGEELSDTGKLFVGKIKDSIEKLKDYIDITLKSYKNVAKSTAEKEYFELDKLLKKCISLLDFKNEHEFILPTEKITLYHYRPAFKQIIMNLMSNAIKYNDKEKCRITIEAQDFFNHFEIIVKDNGRGIPEEKLDSIFEMFTHSDEPDRFNNVGTGIGLATVQSLVRKLNGTITVSSKVGEGTSFKLLFYKV
ncbi:sensor histidine kinase [Flavobacterium sp. XGLA_31]|uniref:sensor histidine kinase n=1 Tax=Flavobacterium sp. XGLA_31 TaxID=3447666 RepID=UPI003F330FEE